MKTVKNLKLTTILFLILMSFSCNEDEVSTNNGTSSISVRLMDDPADYDNVFIEVVDVEVKLNDYSNDENGWQSLNPINTGIYDLLELTGGVNVLLVDDFQIPSGTLNEIRLVLGDDNIVVIDGESFLLKTPSAQQSGLKIKVNETLEENISYTFLLDFVVDESIVVAGNSSNIILKPVIRGSIEAKTGAISGQVLPTGIQVEVATEIDGETISTYTNEDGNFMLVGLEEGTYSIIVTPEEASGFTPLVIEDIEVTIGNTTTIETVNFE